MALSIKDDEADRLARELARHTGETLTQAVIVALRERLERVAPSAGSTLLEDLERIVERNARRRILDRRPEDEILGYDESGLPA
ncbi:MAG: type II toxin-antitoxin system VapB family antitoxin [Candidatus Eremiobacterota bacterium]